LAVEFASVMIAGILIFRFEVQGMWLEYILFAVLGAASFTAIALLCASRTRSIPMVSGLTNLISIPMMMLSGVFFSKTNLPSWMQSAVEFLPLTALNDGLRKIALEGQGLANLTTECTVLLGYLIVAGVTSRIVFRWY